MIANRTLTESGANWIRKALDPFHDFEVRIDGLPDEDTSRVVIQEVSLTQTFGAPSGDAGNWDMHVFTLPELENTWTTLPRAVTVSGNGGYYDASAQPQPASGAYNFGLVNVFCTPSGTPTTPNGSAFGAGSTDNVFDFSPYFIGQKRLIALAFEVHDTTAELYKQGAVICYRLPQVLDDSILSPGGTNYAKPSQSFGVISRCPPALPSEAFIMPGARQWEAKEGCYCVAVMDAKRNDLSGSMVACRVFTRGDMALNGAAGSQVGIGTTPTFSGTAVPFFATCDPCKPTPFHTAGAYFTGLNVQSTLTVTARAIFESCPTPENSQLVVLSKPSPDYDPVALEIYKSASAKLPVGVPVGMNASGDFWDEVLGIVSEVAPMVGSLLPIPGAGMLGNMIGKGAKMGKEVRNREKDAPASDRKQISNNFSANGNKNAAPKGALGTGGKKK